MMQEQIDNNILERVTWEPSRDIIHYIPTFLIKKALKIMKKLSRCVWYMNVWQNPTIKVHL